MVVAIPVRRADRLGGPITGPKEATAPHVGLGSTAFSVGMPAAPAMEAEGVKRVAGGPRPDVGLVGGIDHRRGVRTGRADPAAKARSVLGRDGAGTGGGAGAVFRVADRLQGWVPNR